MVIGKQEEGDPAPDMAVFPRMDDNLTTSSIVCYHSSLSEEQCLFPKISFCPPTTTHPIYFEKENQRQQFKNQRKFWLRLNDVCCRLLLFSMEPTMTFWDFVPTLPTFWPPWTIRASWNHFSRCQEAGSHYSPTSGWNTSKDGCPSGMGCFDQLRTSTQGISSFNQTFVLTTNKLFVHTRLPKRQTMWQKRAFPFYEPTNATYLWAQTF